MANPSQSGNWPLKCVCPPETSNNAIIFVDIKLCPQYAICYHFIRQLEIWANAQRDGRPAEYRWRPLFNAAIWLAPTSRVPCSNAAKMRNRLKLPGVPLN